MIKILHCADLHFDSPFAGVVDAEMAEILRSAALKAFSRLVDLALERQVDALTIAGDVYDLADHGLHALVAFHDQLRRLSVAGIPCCMVAGNHDPLKKRRRGLVLPAGCHLFGAAAARRALLSRKGQAFSIYGISFADSAVKEDLAARLIEAYQEDEGTGAWSAIRSIRRT